MFKFLSLLFFVSVISNVSKVPSPDQVCGKWMSSEKSLIVEVYKEKDEYKAKVIWFKNTDTSKRMDEWTDKHNPDPAFRNRKLIGMSILKNMIYVPKSNSWENGTIYDAKNGREWDASAYIDKNGELRVTGYWHLKFIGRTMSFTRI